MSDRGLIALADAIGSGSMRRLRNIHFDDNTFGDVVSPRLLSPSPTLSSRGSR